MASQKTKTEPVEIEADETYGAAREMLIEERVDNLQDAGKSGSDTATDVAAHLPKRAKGALAPSGFETLR